MDYAWPKTCAKRQVISNENVSTVWSLTVGGVSNPWPLLELSCMGTGINSESDTEIGGAGGEYASVANVVVGV